MKTAIKFSTSDLGNGGREEEGCVQFHQLYACSQGEGCWVPSSTKLPCPALAENAAASRAQVPGPLTKARLFTGLCAPTIFAEGLPGHLSPAARLRQVLVPCHSYILSLNRFFPHLKGDPR